MVAATVTAMASAQFLQGQGQILRGADGNLLTLSGRIPGFVPGAPSPPPPAIISAQVANPQFLGGISPVLIAQQQQQQQQQQLRQQQFQQLQQQQLSGLPLGAIGSPLLQGSGLEGQYIPDNLEQLYDDGSYKPWLYGL